MNVCERVSVKTLKKAGAIPAFLEIEPFELIQYIYNLVYHDPLLPFMVEGLGMRAKQ